MALRVRARGEAREAREVRNRVVIVICLVDDKPRRVDEVSAPAGCDRITPDVAPPAVTSTIPLQNGRSQRVPEKPGAQTSFALGTLTAVAEKPTGSIAPMPLSSKLSVRQTA